MLQLEASASIAHEPSGSIEDGGYSLESTSSASLESVSSAGTVQAIQYN